jgi:threonine aldolase
MAAAEVGDDVFGEDPTIRALELEAAIRLGQPAALYLPSGTMANQVAIHVHCRPGDELICEERSHVYQYEGGSIARLSGTQVRLLTAEDGFPSPDHVVAAIRRDDPHHARSRLLVLENTHNMAGGRVLAPERFDAIVAAAKSRGLLVHVDGARLANAAVALDVPLARLTLGVDSVTLCLSKGLGAPVGSMLAGSSDFIAAARRVRKAFGGGMRQAGVIAAAGLIALREGPTALRVDHERARSLAAGLTDLAGMRPAPTATNIVMLDFEAPVATECVAWLRRHDVLALPIHERRVRFVFHRDVPDDAVQRVLVALADFVPNPIRT